MSGSEQTGADNSQWDSNAAAAGDNSSYDWSQYYAQQGYDYSQYSGYYDQSQYNGYYDQAAYNNYYYPSTAASGVSTPSYGDAGTPSAPKEGLPEPISIEELNRVSNRARGGASGKKPTKIVRTAGGETWEDSTLTEWDPNDYRLFAGDLGPEVDDEMLTRAFSKFPSFQKAKVVMDKRAQKSKGYGFVSFNDADDFVRAWKEMNGKYVGNRPIKLRKSTWKERNLDVRAKKESIRATPYSKPR
ncbi:unnamed protein product [Umbelopsis ramanniana]